MKQIANFAKRIRIAGLILPLVVAFSLFALPAVAGAQLTDPGAFGGQNTTTFSDPTSTIRRVVNYVLAIVLIIDVAIIIAGGFLIITAAGSDRAKTGKSMVLNAVIGLIIIVFAYTISLSIASIARNFN